MCSRLNKAGWIFGLNFNHMPWFSPYCYTFNYHFWFRSISASCIWSFAYIFSSIWFGNCSKFQKSYSISKAEAASVWSSYFSPCLQPLNPYWLWSLDMAAELYNITFICCCWLKRLIKKWRLLGFWNRKMLVWILKKGKYE